MDPNERRTLVMLTKFWEAGTTKTRLARVIGNDRAAMVSQAFVRYLGRRLSRVGDRRFVAVTPENRTPEVAAEVGPMWSVTPQGEGDLGARLDRVFRDAMAIGGRSVVIGSDSPDIPVESVELAFARLREVPVVIGPARDGGIYLLGFAGRFTTGHQRILENVDWGSSKVERQLRKLIEREELAYQSLEPWWDVDVAEDLQQLQDRLAEKGDEASELQSLIAAVLRAQGGAGTTVQNTALDEASGRIAAKQS